jgi:uncharacterized protein (DUF2141 family)
MLNKIMSYCACGVVGMLVGCQPANQQQTSTSKESAIVPVKEIKIVVKKVKFENSDDQPASPSQLCWALFAGPDGFPSDSSKVVRSGCIDVNGSIHVFRISDLPPSQSGYVVSLFQDMNLNGKLDTRKFFGFDIPDEPFGFTKNPSLMGAPTFEKCKINPTTEGEEFVIEMKTM